MQTITLLSENTHLAPPAQREPLRAIPTLTGATITGRETQQRGRCVKCVCTDWGIFSLSQSTSLCCASMSAAWEGVVVWEWLRWGLRCELICSNPALIRIKASGHSLSLLVIDQQPRLSERSVWLSGEQHTREDTLSLSSLEKNLFLCLWNSISRCCSASGAFSGRWVSSNRSSPYRRPTCSVWADLIWPLQPRAVPLWDAETFVRSITKAVFAPAGISRWDSDCHYQVWTVRIDRKIDRNFCLSGSKHRWPAMSMSLRVGSQVWSQHKYCRKYQLVIIWQLYCRCCCSVSLLLTLNQCFTGAATAETQQIYINLTWSQTINRLDRLLK